MSHQDASEIDRHATELARAVNQSARSGRHKAVHGAATVAWQWSDHGTMVTFGVRSREDRSATAMLDARVLHHNGRCDAAAILRACRHIAALPGVVSGPH